MLLDLQPGDIACTTYHPSEDDFNILQWLFSTGIRWVQCFNDVDGKAEKTHSLLITSSRGTTFEALSRYKFQSVYQAYAGRPVLIGRHKNMTRRGCQDAYVNLLNLYYGRYYPAWKIPMFFLTPRLLKYLPGKPVCSEFCFQHWYMAGLVDHWRGVTPSYVSDAIRRWRSIEIIYEGIMPGKENND